MFDHVVKLAGDAGIPEVVRLLQEGHRQRIRALNEEARQIAAGRTAWAPPVATDAPQSPLAAELARLAEIGVEPLAQQWSGEHELRVVYAHPNRPGLWIDAQGRDVGEVDPAGGTRIHRARETIAVLLALPEFYAQFALVGDTAPLVALVLENERAVAAGRYELAQMRGLPGTDVKS